MRELRTQESSKFERFFEIVREEARRHNAVFFCDCGEGRDIITDSIEGEDLSGWLIPISDADNFEKVFKMNSRSAFDDWAEFICFAIWSQTEDGTINIEFKKF